MSISPHSRGSLIELKVCFQGSNQQYANMPDMRQASIWNSDDIVYWRIYLLLGFHYWGERNLNAQCLLFIHIIESYSLQIKYYHINQHIILGWVQYTDVSLGSTEWVVRHLSLISVCGRRKIDLQQSDQCCHGYKSQFWIKK